MVCRLTILEEEAESFPGLLPMVGFSLLLPLILAHE